MRDGLTPERKFRKAIFTGYPGNGERLSIRPAIVLCCNRKSDSTAVSARIAHIASMNCRLPQRMFDALILNPARFTAHGAV